MDYKCNIHSHSHSHSHLIDRFIHCKHHSGPHSDHQLLHLDTSLLPFFEEISWIMILLFRLDHLYKDFHEPSVPDLWQWLKSVPKKLQVNAPLCSFLQLNCDNLSIFKLQNLKCFICVYHKRLSVVRVR